LFQLDEADAGYNGRAVLRGISLVIEPGERIALVGRSGAGKSTLLTLLYEQQKDRTALVPQEAALVRTLSVFHNVYAGRLDRHGALYNLANLVRPMGREVSEVRAITDALGLSDKLFEAAGALSGGQQQRTAVARALFHGGDALLGDEPVSAVDEHQARSMLAAINDAFETVVLAMHDMTLALEFTDRIIGLDHGRVVMDEAAAGLTPADLAVLYRD
jgi:phosphonate transport system ATP-binding protein